jgi:predicted ATP-binding protein involved in virulence
MSSLNIRKLRLRDYRCFDAIDIDFHPQLTVLVAANGAGKTSILDAIAVAFGPYVGAFDEAVGKHFEPSDIRQFQARKTASHEMEFAAQGARLEATGIIPDGPADGIEEGLLWSWKRALTSPSKAKTTIKDAKDLIDYGKRMQEAARTPGNEAVLPLIAYYGTGRLWQQKKLMAGKKLPRTSRTIGYTDCLDPGSSYKTFASWFRYWSLNAKDLQLKDQADTPDYKEFAGYIASVKDAVDACLTPADWKNLEYSFKLDALIAHHDQHGELPVELLSDGIRNMIAMVADIAFRATKLNGQLGAKASAQTPGIVLIDEVDMHLHPEWQQVVLQSLVQAFPALQFIVTTHSPQVLSTVRRENIRIIGPDASGKIIAAQPLAMTYGEPSGDVLHSVMMVDPQPPVAEKADLQRLTEWVDQGNYKSEEATQLMQHLIATLGARHPQLQKLQRSIQRQEVLKQ